MFTVPYLAPEQPEQTSKPHHTARPVSRSASTSWAYKGNARSQGLPLPQELLDVIIDWLKDDKPSLSNCALVARAWRPRSQVHIHRTLKVSSRECCQHAERLYSDPFLASCIREFLVLDIQLNRNKTFDHWPNFIVPAMLSTLNHVHPLAIDAVVLQNGTGVRWGDFREPLFPHATKLTIDRLDFRVGSEFAAFMRHFPRLTSLSLRDFTIEYTKRDIEAPGPRPALRKLEIYSSTGQEFFMNWFLHQPAENIQLETLVYSVERWELRVPKPSLIALGASVKDITIVFAFESPHYLLKGDPILPSLSSVRSLTFDLATLYGTLYGPPSIPLLLEKLSSAARVSTVRFKFALDSQSTPLTSVVEKLERLKLAQTDALLHALPPFSELQDLLIQVRSNEWVRLKKEPSVEAWFASDKHKWSGEQCFVPLKLTEASGRLEVETLPTLAQSNIHFSHAGFDLANMTWRKVTSVLQGAFPTMAARKILRVEPLEDESSERERWRPRVYDGHHQEPTAPNVYHQPRAPIFPYILHFPYLP